MLKKKIFKLLPASRNSALIKFLNLVKYGKIFSKENYPSFSELL